MFPNIPGGRTPLVNSGGGGGNTHGTVLIAGPPLISGRSLSTVTVAALMGSQMDPLSASSRSPVLHPSTILPCPLPLSLLFPGVVVVVTDRSRSFFSWSPKLVLLCSFTFSRAVCRLVPPHTHSARRTAEMEAHNAAAPPPARLTQSNQLSLWERVGAVYTRGIATLTVSLARPAMFFAKQEYSPASPSLALYTVRLFHLSTSLPGDDDRSLYDEMVSTSDVA